MRVFCAERRRRASPSLSEDSCAGSGVVLLLSVFWLQLDGWLLAFLCFLLTSACRDTQFNFSQP